MRAQHAQHVGRRLEKGKAKTDTLGVLDMDAWQSPSAITHNIELSVTQLARHSPRCPVNPLGQLCTTWWYGKAALFLVRVISRHLPHKQLPNQHDSPAAPWAASSTPGQPYLALHHSLMTTCVWFAATSLTPSFQVDTTHLLPPR